jgi:hypothetical protein
MKLTDFKKVWSTKIPFGYAPSKVLSKFLYLLSHVADALSVYSAWRPMRSCWTCITHEKMYLLMLLPPSKIAYTMYTYLLQFSILCFCDADTCTNILLRMLRNSAFSIVLHSAYTILKRRSNKHYRCQWDLYLCSMSNVSQVVYVCVHLMKCLCIWTGLALCAVQSTLIPCLDNVSFHWPIVYSLLSMVYCEP